MARACRNCQDKTTEPDQLCPLCKADYVAHIGEEIEAMMQYNGLPYHSVRTEAGRVIVEVFNRGERV